MKALFEVGEEVILVSKNYPRLSGDCKVLRVQMPSNKLKIGDCCGGGIGVTDTISYELTIKNPKGCCFLWKESSLRKKPKAWKNERMVFRKRPDFMTNPYGLSCDLKSMPIHLQQSARDVIAYEAARVANLAIEKMIRSVKA